MQPVVVRARQSDAPVTVALQTDVQSFVGIKHGHGDLGSVEKAQPKLDAGVLPLLRRQGSARPTIPRKERIFAFPLHGAKLRRHKLPQLAIALEHMAVGIDHRKRSLHSALLAFFYYPPVVFVNMKRNSLLTSRIAYRM